MKKLTAGIFATILGLTAVDAFAATGKVPVASTNYVHDVVKTLDSSKDNGTAPIAGVTLTDGKVTAVTAADMSAYALKTDVNTSLGDYVTTDTYTQGQAAQDLALTNGLATKADKSELKDWVLESTYTSGQSAQDTRIKALEDANAALGDTYATDKELTDGLATKADKSQLKDWVLTSTYDAGMALKADKTELNGLATEGYVDAAVLTEHNVNEQQAQTINAQAQQISGILEEQDTQNDAIDALEAAAGNYVTWADVVDSYGSN